LQGSAQLLAAETASLIEKENVECRIMNIECRRNVFCLFYKKD